MSRLNISTGAKWEDLVGYSRAVKMGNTVEVSGTVSIKDGLAWGKNDPYEQTKQIISIIKDTLEKAGATLNDVIRTRIYVTNASKWPEVGRAHQEFFSDIKPATSMVEVSALISDEYEVEIEATAIINA